MRKQAIIFDVDGTLVDTNEAHVEAWERAFARLGYAVSRGRLRPQIGKGGDKLVPALIGAERGARDGEALREAHSEAFAEVAKRTRFRVFPGVREVMGELRRMGLKVAVATSSNAEHFDAVMKSAGLAITALADEVVTKSEAGESKPAPDLVEAALAKLSLPADRCVMVGDTPYDAEASRKAGVPCVGLLCGGIFSGPELIAAGAREVFATPEELRRHLDRVAL